MCKIWHMRTEHVSSPTDWNGVPTGFVSYPRRYTDLKLPRIHLIMISQCPNWHNKSLDLIEQERHEIHVFYFLLRFGDSQSFSDLTLSSGTTKWSPKLVSEVPSGARVALAQFRRSDTWGPKTGHRQRIGNVCQRVASRTRVDIRIWNSSESIGSGFHGV